MSSTHVILGRPKSKEGIEFYEVEGAKTADDVLLSNFFSLAVLNYIYVELVSLLTHIHTYLTVSINLVVKCSKS